MISRQWFVKIEPLAKPAIDAVRNGTIQIIPQSWEATYFNWMENIHDWTISRQLWWGHRIPAFYCANGHMTVAVEDPASCPKCGSTRDHAGDRRARHLVLVGALAVLDDGLAGETRRPARSSIRPTS